MVAMYLVTNRSSQYLLIKQDFPQPPLPIEIILILFTAATVRMGADFRTDPGGTALEVFLDIAGKDHSQE
jgi:hypothetical protein